MIHVITPFREGDIVLARSRWIATRTVARLTELGAPVVSMDTFDPQEDVRGFAFFGHGDSIIFLLDGRGSSLIQPPRWEHLRGRWFHAFACHGRSFAEAAVAHGATRVAGYEVNLQPRWSEDEIDPEVRPMVEHVFTLTTELLATNVPTPALVDAVRQAVETVTAWFDEHSGGGNVRLLCEQLYSDLFVLPDHTPRRRPHGVPSTQNPSR